MADCTAHVARRTTRARLGLRAASAAAWGLFALTLAAAPHSPQQTFRSRVDLVDIEVSVLDRHRQPVRGLTAADFTVYEDDRPRPVLAFTPVDLPTRVLPTAPWMDAVAPEIATNVFPREGRLVVILFDRSISTTQRPVAVEAAESIVAQLRPGDLAAVVYSTFGTPQNFTSDRERLLQAMYRPLAIRADGDPGNPAECYCGTCTLDAIGRVADAIRDVRQRRKILFLIGSNISIQSTNACSGPLTQSRNRTTRALEAGERDGARARSVRHADARSGRVADRRRTASADSGPPHSAGQSPVSSRSDRRTCRARQSTHRDHSRDLSRDELLLCARGRAEHGWRPRPLPRAFRQGPSIRSRGPGAAGLLHDRRRSARIFSAAGPPAEPREGRVNDVAAHRPAVDDARGPVRGARAAVFNHRHRRARGAAD